MAFDLARRSPTSANWSRGEMSGDGMPKVKLVVGALAGLAALGGWLMWSGKKAPVAKRKNSTFIMAKTPSGRVYAGPLADYYRKV